MVAKQKQKAETKQTGAKKKSAQKADVKQSRERYFEGIGRRKVAVSRVRLMNGTGKFVILGTRERSIEEYFPVIRMRDTARAPLLQTNLAEKFDVSIRVRGGGLNAQAEATRLGIARALVKADETLKKNLRILGFLTRDARMVERKKYGLKKARRAPQWSKR